MLGRLVTAAAARVPDAPAISATDGTVSYGELDALAGRAAHVLRNLGVARGDRVGIWHDKSAATVAAMQGVLRLGAAYVPIDPLSPPLRAQKILSDCDVRVLVANRSRAESLPPNRWTQVPCLSMTESFLGGPTWNDVLAAPAVSSDGSEAQADDLAYILYTSGSTGQPKGVCISHANALAFVEWATKTVGIRTDDRLANHAGFHFDLSVFDLYAAFSAGACVCIVPEREAFIPSKLVERIAHQRITIWYSVPSALVLMLEQGELAKRTNLPLRCILFAGEPFPIKHLRRLQQCAPGAKLFNFYGPTETNVCTYHEVDYALGEDVLSIPIGMAACGNRVWARTHDGSRASVGESGELCVDGPTVMLGYWGQPPQAGLPYATGDIVRHEPNGEYSYMGRRDHMVKVHGHRVELGEIENALALHPSIEQVAVVVFGSGVYARLVAFIVGCGEERPSLLEAKAHCARHLPRHMIVDKLHYVPSLPRTPNGKVDRTNLLHWLSSDRMLATREEETDGITTHVDGAEDVSGTGAVGRH